MVVETFVDYWLWWTHGKAQIQTDSQFYNHQVKTRVVSPHLCGLLGCTF